MLATVVGMTNTPSKSPDLDLRERLDHFIEFLWDQNWAITESANDGSHWVVDRDEVIDLYLQRSREASDAEDACSGSPSSLDSRS